MGFPGGASGKESTCQCRRLKRPGFDPWIGKISWKRKEQPTPVFSPGESRGQRSLAGSHTVHGVAKSQSRKSVRAHTRAHTHTHTLGIQKQIGSLTCPQASLVAQMVKNLLARWETQVRSLSWEDPLEKGRATHSILAQRFPWTKGPGGLQSMGSQRVRHD